MLIYSSTERERMATGMHCFALILILMLKLLSELTQEDVKCIDSVISEIQESLKEYLQKQRARKIQELEQQQSEIARQLQALRGEEPNLFNMI